MSRAIEKTTTKLDGNCVFLNDTIRITITPKLPEYIDFITKYLAEKNIKFFKSNDWTISPSGVMHCGVYLDIDGNVAQTEIDEKIQRELNLNISHDIYLTMRLLEGKDFKFSLMNANYEMIEKFKTGYNSIIKKYGKSTDLNFNVEEEDSFRLYKLNDRYKELLLIHQNIHVNEICTADVKWQKLYFSLILNLNKKEGANIFPETLILKIKNSIQSITSEKGVNL